MIKELLTLLNLWLPRLMEWVDKLMKESADKKLAKELEAENKKANEAIDEAFKSKDDDALNRGFYGDDK